MVYSIYVTKKQPYAVESKNELENIQNNLNIKSLQQLIIYNKYDVEGITKEVFDKCVLQVFSEPQVDDVYNELPIHLYTDKVNLLPIEYLPGQFDQRADSAKQCIMFVTPSNIYSTLIVKTSKVIVLIGDISSKELETIKNYMINPVESRLANLKKKTTLVQNINAPEKTPIIYGFINLDKSDYQNFIKKYSLSMDTDDLDYCKKYFEEKEKRNPTLTEIKMIDTYWSDHCRHTTFTTHLTNIEINNPIVKLSFEKYKEIRKKLNIKKEITLMDIATIGAKYLSFIGKLKSLDESEEINACSVKIDVDVSINSNTHVEKWLLMFKNETHNHPTEIEPFGGAATCLGGAIRDPLSGRSYVYQAMRLTGAENPLTPISQTMKGKLAQSTICKVAAAGYSSYGNQIGLSTGLVQEFYHSGFVAKRMEVGAVIGAAPSENIVREVPQKGDVVILLGGATGRDGVGGASGSSKAHDESSLETCGAEVQKGNPTQERKIQRLFRNSQVSKMIKRCNDFGAGGISVAIGELADGLDINLDVVPLKYEGLTATELAISESQERMAVVISQELAQEFINLAEKENLQAVVVANVTDKNRLTMNYKGDLVVDLCRDFLNSSGAIKQNDVKVDSIKNIVEFNGIDSNIQDDWNFSLSNINTASQRGLVEMFDSTIGSASVTMPYGGKRQLTQTQAMVALIPVLSGETSTCSIMSYGYDPYLQEQSPYLGAYMAVVSSVAKIIASGGGLDKCWLSFQEYFESLKKDPVKWGNPFEALLGALEAQLALGIASIGGKDSMSGTFENISVPPTLISFAVGVSDAKNIITPEFKHSNSDIYLIEPVKNNDMLYDQKSLLDIYNEVIDKIKNGDIISAWAVGFGGLCEGVTKMGMGNKIGVIINDLDYNEFFEKKYGAIIVETTKNIDFGRKIGKTTNDYKGYAFSNVINLEEMENNHNLTLEPVYKTNVTSRTIKTYNKISFNSDIRNSPAIKIAKPRVLIPVFPGTNCEYDTARAFEKYGGEANILIIRNRTANDIEQSTIMLGDAIRKSQIVALPGGFSCADEPDGSGKFIVSLFRNPYVKNEVQEFLQHNDGLMCGICNGFQALVKLGLVPFGKITTPNELSPTLTFNSIGRHQSRLVDTRIASNKSPWFTHHNVGDIQTVAISHGEGRFVSPQSHIDDMIKNGQIATQYVDKNQNPTNDIMYNPNNSYLAIEGITSPDGRILGKMGHSERFGKHLYKNVPNISEQLIFKGGIDYFR